MKTGLTRREFMQLAAAATGMAVLSACGAGGGPAEAVGQPVP